MRVNLHLAGDDKFIDTFINSASNQTNTYNRFIIYTKTNSKPTFVRSDSIEYAPYNSILFYKLIGNWNLYSAIYIHFLSAEMVDLINKIPINLKIIWCFYGADAFSYYKLRNKFLDYNTKLFLFNQRSLRGKIFYPFETTVRDICDRRNNFQYLKALRRIDYFAHFIEDDYKLVKKVFDIKAKFINFTYGNIDDFKFEINNQNTNFNSILLGNSGSETNNHITILKFLYKHHFKGQIYCPLSYGGSINYINNIIHIGNKFFHNNFVPLTKYIPLNEYNQIINKIEVAFMNHYRSQAHGNILGLIYAGKRIVMNKESSLYQYYCSLGLKIEVLEDFANACNSKIFIKKNAEINKNIIAHEFGTKRYMSRLINILTI